MSGRKEFQMTLLSQLFMRVLLTLVLPASLYGATFTVNQTPPPGFKDFSAAQTTRLDIHYGRKLMGSAMATFDVDHFEFSNPEHVAQLVGRFINDPKTISAALTGQINTHTEELCPIGQSLGCGVIRPKIVGIIFDESQFHVDLFIASAYLKTVDLQENEFLPPPEKQISTINLLSAHLSGGDNSEKSQQIEIDSIIAYGRTHFSQRLSYNLEHDPEISKFLLTHSGNKLAYSAGTLRTRGLTSSLISNPQIIGGRAAVSLLMHRNRSTFFGSPLVIFLGERSRVDLIYEGRIVRSSFYEAGNQIIDTTSLPNGSYSIELKISNSRGVRIENQFFTRSPIIPPKNNAAHFLEFGRLLEEDRLTRSPKITNQNLVNFGSSFRLHDRVGAEIQWLQSNFSETLMQAGITYLLPQFTQHAGIFGSRSGAFGENYNFIFQRSNFSFTGIYRNLNKATWAADNTPDLLVISPGQYWEMGISGKLFGGSIILNYRNRKEDHSETENYLLSYRKSVFRSASMRADLTAEINSRAGEQSYSVGFNIGRTSKHSRTSFSLGSKENLQEGHQEFLNSHYSRHFIDSKKRNLTGTAFSSLNNITHTAGIGLNGMSEWGAAAFDISQNFSHGDSPLTYSLDLGSAILSSGTSISLGASSRKTAGLIVEVNSDAIGDFEVLVNDNVQTSFPAGRKTSVLLDPYQNYQIQIRDKGDALYKLDAAEKSVTVLPGNITHLSWDAHKVVVLVARAVDDFGEPIANARFTNVTEFSTTDESGWFQIELAGEKTLILETADEAVWTLKVPRISENEEVMVAGDLKGVLVSEK